MFPPPQKHPPAPSLFQVLPLDTRQGAGEDVDVVLGVNLHHLQPKHLAGEGDTRVNSAQRDVGREGETDPHPFEPPHTCCRVLPARLTISE